MEMEDVYVVLPAGGCGLRMEIDTPKQYCEVLNRPLILFTIQSFHRFTWIKCIVVVVADSYMEYMEKLLIKYGFTKVKLVAGSQTRHRSIYNGIKALENICKPEDVVIVHDAVRMFTDEETIIQVAMAAKEYKASGVFRSLVSTVIAPDSEGFLEESLDRNKYRASEMPQGFQYSVILSAYQKATDYDFDYGTECLLLASKYSAVKAKLIEGSSNLWKVTHKKDLYAAEGILKESDIGVCLQCTEDQLQNLLTVKLKKNNFKILTEENRTEPAVFINVLDYNENACDKCVQCTEQLLKQCNTKQLRHNLLDYVLMFVVKILEESDYMFVFKLIQHLKKMVEGEEILIYCVVYQDGNQLEELSDLVTSVVWNRDRMITGQALICAK